MPVVDTQIKTLTCDGRGCDKTVTFDPKGFQQASQENPWLKTSRVVNTLDGRTLFYCSDLCEVAGIETGLHNIPEQPKIQTASEAQIAAAAAAAKAAQASTQAIKEGKPVTLHQS